MTIQEIWKMRNHHLSEELREYVEMSIIGAESKPLYIFPGNQEPKTRT